MYIIYLRIFILLLFCALAAYTDKKTGYIYDWITLPLIFLGIIINLFVFPFSKNLSFFTTGAIIFAIGFVIYYLGKLGGGDIKLFLGIHFMLPYLNDQLFILWVLVTSCFLGVIFISIKYIFILFKKIKFTKKLLVAKIPSIITSFVLFVLFFVFLYFSVNYSDISSWFYLTLIPILLGLFINIFQEEVKKHIYLLWKEVKDIEDGDVIASEYLTKSLEAKLKPILRNKKVIEEKDIKLMIEKKITQKLPIYYFLPKFGPYIFLGIIVSVFVLLYFF